MTLINWAENGWLRRHQATRQEISDLLAIVDRDIKDSQTGTVSADWQFGIAYNAALKLCTILLSAEGFRTGIGLQHYRTIQAMPLILGETKKNDAQFLDVCRIKRNTSEYDKIGTISDGEVKEIIDLVKELRMEVLKWLKDYHPDLTS
jgi:hypothetical protein